MDCPKCGSELEKEMSFIDCFDYKSGHYTRDYPILVCTNKDCDYQTDYIEEEEEYVY